MVRAGSGLASTMWSISSTPLAWTAGSLGGALLARVGRPSRSREATAPRRSRSDQSRIRLPSSRPTRRTRTVPIRQVPSGSTVKPASRQLAGSSPTTISSMVGLMGGTYRAPPRSGARPRTGCHGAAAAPRSAGRARLVSLSDLPGATPCSEGAATRSIDGRGTTLMAVAGFEGPDDPGDPGRPRPSCPPGRSRTANRSMTSPRWRRPPTTAASPTSASDPTSPGRHGPIRRCRGSRSIPSTSTIRSATSTSGACRRPGCPARPTTPRCASSISPMSSTSPPSRR